MKCLSRILVVLFSYVINAIGIACSILMNIHNYREVGELAPVNNFQFLNSEIHRSFFLESNYFFILNIFFTGLLFFIITAPLMIIFGKNVRNFYLVISAIFQIFFFVRIVDSHQELLWFTAIGILPTYLVFVFSMFMQSKVQIQLTRIHASVE